ncbi:MAG: pyrroloquinoline quinone-dependent dehydrogenase, partial [Bryobacteraceae bacterium]
AIQALDAASGDLLWQYIRPTSGPQGFGASQGKGLAIYGDKLFAPTSDGHVIALDVHTGHLAWDQEVVPSGSGGLSLNSAPIVVKGTVIAGVSLGVSSPGGCFIIGLDAQTGKERWRFHTIARPGQPGGDSWNGAPVDERFGGGVWTAGSYDAQLGLVYFGVGNTYDTATLLLPQPYPMKSKSNDALYTDSTLALDPDTGKLAWFYQHMNRDVWDLDWAFEQSLITLPIDGKPADLVVTGGKIAMFDAVNRADGKYEFSTDLGLQNVVASVDPATGKKNINPELQPEANKTKLLCPNANGARNWPATSYDPETKILYVPMVESCADFTWIPGNAAQTAAGGEDMHFTLRPRPDTDGNFGRIEAVNLETKKVVWIDRQRAPVASSMLSTAGGLVFNGTRDQQFTAYDAANGKILWHVRLNASPSSSPVTYAIGRKQYIAVVAGGGGTLDAGGGGLTPEIDNPVGTTLWTFALPGASENARQ